MSVFKIELEIEILRIQIRIQSLEHFLYTDRIFESKLLTSLLIYLLQICNVTRVQQTQTFFKKIQPQERKKEKEIVREESYKKKQPNPKRLTFSKCNIWPPSSAQNIF